MDQEVEIDYFVLMRQNTILSLSKYVDNANICIMFCVTQKGFLYVQNSKTKEKRF